MSQLPPGSEVPLSVVDSPTGAPSSERGSYLVAAGILLSRVAGLAREIAISFYLGVGATADVFKAALRIPNLLQNLLGEGVLSASFIPVYSRLLEEDRQAANRLAGKILGLLLTVMAAVVAVGILFAHPLTLVITPGLLGRAARAGHHPPADHVPGHRLPGAVGVLHRHPQQPPTLLPLVRLAGDVERDADRLRRGGRGVGRDGGGDRPRARLGRARGRDRRGRHPGPVGAGPARAGPGWASTSGPPTCRTSSAGSSPWSSAGASSSSSSTSTSSWPASWRWAACRRSPTDRCSTCSRSACSGWRWRRPSCPELARLGRAGAAAIKDRLHVGMERITFYVAITVALYVFAGDVIVAVLLQRGEFTAADTQLVWYVVAVFALGLLGTTRSRLLQNGLYALDRPKLVARIAVFRVALAGLLGAFFMFPFDRFAIVDGSVTQMGSIAFRPLPDSVRLMEGGPPRLGVVGLALGAALSSWVEYRLLKGAIEWRIGALPPMGQASTWCLIAAAGCGVLAGGPPVRHGGPPPAGHRGGGLPPDDRSCTSSSPPSCRCRRRPTSSDRLRRLLAGGRSAQR